MPSIHDIAKEAGVSKSTVSRVVRGAEGVKPRTRERVLAVIEATGYVPDYFGQCLRGQKTDTVGILIPDFASPYYPEIFKAIDGALRASGVLSLACNTGQSSQTELDCLKQLLGRKVDGLIYLTYDQSEPVIQCLLTAALGGTPVVFMDPVLRDEPLTSVVCNGFEGSRQAAAYLLARGRRRLGYIKGRARHWVTRERFQGFERALAEVGLMPRPELTFEGDFTLEGGCAGARYLMAQNPPPDAILAANDVMAIGALRWLRQAGARVPEDVAVVGFDNIRMAELVEPGLTTVKQPIGELGRRAAELVLRNREREHCAPERVVLDCELIVRGSTP